MKTVDGIKNDREILRKENAELKEVLSTVRDNMQTRMVVGFDHDKSVYPITSGTITTLLLENAELKNALELAKQVEKTAIASFVKKTDREKLLETENAELHQRLIDVDWCPDISTVMRENRELKEQLSDMHRIAHHYHVNSQDGTDTCKKCGRDLRHLVHLIPEGSE